MMSFFPHLFSLKHLLQTSLQTLLDPLQAVLVLPLPPPLQVRSGARPFSGLETCRGGRRWKTLSSAVFAKPPGKGCVLPLPKPLPWEVNISRGERGMECLRGSKGEKGWSVGVEEGRSRGEGKDSQTAVEGGDGKGFTGPDADGMT
jgi:hypothetical protein